MATYIGTLGNDSYPGPGDDNSGDDTIHDGGGGNDVLLGGDGDDQIIITGGRDTVDGGADQDLLIIDYSSESGNFVSFQSSPGVGFFIITAGTSVEYRGIERFNITTGGFNDNIDITVAGDAAGDDVINAGTGLDTVNAGAGSDRLVVDYSDQIFFGGSVSVSTLSGNLASGYQGSVVANDSIFGVTNRVDFVGIESFDITGSFFSDTLVTGDGDDRLDGGGGDDTLQGGGGDDSYFVDNLGDTILETRLGGHDTVESSVDLNTLTNGGVWIEDIVLTGSGDIDAVGNNLDNTITGNGGANIINGYRGADAMTGLGGNDTYVVDNLGDVVIEAEGGGVDLVRSFISFTLGDQTENLHLLGLSAIDATGNAMTNVIRGAGGDNRIEGGGNWDDLSGGGGSDTFVYTQVSDSTRSLYDRIRDLGPDDFIDLDAIDANSRLGGNQDFDHVAAFTRVPGQMTLTHVAAGNFTELQGDVDGDGRADFRIVLLRGNHEGFDGLLGVN